MKRSAWPVFDLSTTSKYPPAPGGVAHNPVGGGGGRCVAVACAQSEQRRLVSVLCRGASGISRPARVAEKPKVQGPRPTLTAAEVGAARRGCEAAMQRTILLHDAKPRHRFGFPLSLRVRRRAFAQGFAVFGGVRHGGVVAVSVCEGWWCELEVAGQLKEQKVPHGPERQGGIEKVQEKTPRKTISCTDAEHVAANNLIDGVARPSARFYSYLYFLFTNFKGESLYSATKSFKAGVGRRF